MPELLFIKLGGSLITDKRTPGTIRLATLRRLAEEIAGSPDRRGRRLVVGHGGGSFGHPAAARFALNRGKLKRDRLPGVSLTQDRAATLHRRVIRELGDAGTLPFSLAPSSFMTAVAGRPGGVRVDPLVLALEQRLLPVVYGDVVMDRSWGASVCSTETVFLALARSLRRRGYIIRRILWFGETDGVYDASGRTVTRIRAKEIDRVLEDVGAAAGADVTGGMAHRLGAAKTLARLGIESWILDGRVPGRLRKALAGERVPGTKIDSES